MWYNHDKNKVFAYHSQKRRTNKPRRSDHPLREGVGTKVIGLNLQDNTMCVYRGEQRVVKEVKDLVEADRVALRNERRCPRFRYEVRHVDCHPGSQLRLP